MAVFKTKDESDGEFVVRALEDAYNQAEANENVARIQKEAAFAALRLARDALAVAQKDALRNGT